MKKPTKKPARKSPDGKRHPSFGASWIKFAAALRRRARGISRRDFVKRFGDHTQTRFALYIAADEARREGERLRKIKR